MSGGTLDADLVVSSTSTTILGDDVGCTTSGACVVALARLESNGQLDVLSAPLSFAA